MHRYVSVCAFLSHIRTWPLLSPFRCAIIYTVVRKRGTVLYKKRKSQIRSRDWQEIRIDYRTQTELDIDWQEEKLSGMDWQKEKVSDIYMDWQKKRCGTDRKKRCQIGTDRMTRCQIWTDKKRKGVRYGLTKKEKVSDMDSAEKSVDWDGEKVKWTHRERGGLREKKMSNVGLETEK